MEEVCGGEGVPRLREARVLGMNEFERVFDEVSGEFGEHVGSAVAAVWFYRASPREWLD